MRVYGNTLRSAYRGVHCIIMQIPTTRSSAQISADFHQIRDTIVQIVCTRTRRSTVYQGVVLCTTP